MHRSDIRPCVSPEPDLPWIARLVARVEVWNHASLRPGFRWGAALVPLLCVLLAAPARAGNVRVSFTDTGAQPNGDCLVQAVSSDGRFVVFLSSATNLPGGGGSPQLFVRDVAQGTTELVSVSPVGARATGTATRNASISADGRYVAFETDATNLVAEDTTTLIKVVVRDRWAGVTVLASGPAPGGFGGGDSSQPSISGNGRYVAFQSSSRLLAADPDTFTDIYVRDLWGGGLERVSVPVVGQNDGGANSPSINYDGRFVAFSSTSQNLVASDTNGAQDVFVRDRLTGVTVRASLPTGGPEANGHSNSAAISWDGRCVAFVSAATNLGAANGLADIFVRDLATGVTERVDVPMGTPAAGLVALGTPVSISADGRFVVFAAQYGQLAPGNVVGGDDVYLRDRKIGVTLRASLDTNGVDPNGQSGPGLVAPLGNMVVFTSRANNIVSGDTNNFADVFAADTASLLFPFRYQAFIKQAYRDLLGRDPEPAALSNWNNFLSQGGSRLDMARSVDQSQEFRHLLVRNLYVRLLRRQADTAGENGWVSFLNGGGTIEELEAQLIASGEYFSVRGGSTNVGFVRAVYSDELNRRTDPAGENNFVNALASGASRVQVARDIINSQEGRILRVRQFYWWLLRRDADPAGLNGGVDALNHGVRDEELIAMIVASDEYFMNAQ